jgi:hypothetical protein
MVPANDSQSVTPAVWCPSNRRWCCAELKGVAAGKVMVWWYNGAMPFMDCEFITGSSLLVLLDDQG